MVSVREIINAGNLYTDTEFPAIASSLVNENTD
jgi:hypothetical protein